jgi:hypothetical protein
MLDNVTMYKGGCLYPVSLSNSTTIKSTINSYLTTLNLLNAFLSTKDESLKAQGPFTIQVRFFMNAFIKGRRNNFQSNSKIYVLALSNCFFPAKCAGSLDE